MPYTHTSKPLCEGQNSVVEQNHRILMKQERTKDWIRFLPGVVLTMNSQESSSTGYTPPPSCSIFQNPFPGRLQEPRRGLAGTRAVPG